MTIFSHIKNFVFLSTAICIPYMIGAATRDCGCELPPQSSPSPEPPLLTFLDQRLAVVYPIIQTFKSLITSDPLGITQSWVGSDICSYRGFYCDSPPDNSSAIALASIDFNGFQLAAPTLDGFLDLLPDLAIFHANTNNFTGIISPKIANLPFLYELDLSNNNFSGLFPISVLQITGLSFLDLRFNSFTGTVPPRVFTQSLDVLFINDNNFMLKLPDNIGSTPALFITFANNKFTGPIPRSIGRASETLIEVLFSNNKLTDCLPYELGLLKKATLIDVSNNLLTGPLPCSLGCLEAAEQLNFAGNQLYGQVPEVMCALQNLANLSLSENYFTRVGPQCRRLVKSGVLDLRKNCVRNLPDQRSAAECAAFLFRIKWCPYHASYFMIPCQLHSGRRSNEPPTPRPSRHLISYSAALRRHSMIGSMSARFISKSYN